MLTARKALAALGIGAAIGVAMVGTGTTAALAQTPDETPALCAVLGNHICGPNVAPANVPVDCFSAPAADYDPTVTPGSRIYLSLQSRDGLCWARADLNSVDAPEWM